MEVMREVVSASGFCIESVNLSQSPGILSEFLDGQAAALAKLGVGDAVLSDEDFRPAPGTYASIVRSDAGKIVGGVRICTREGGRELPLESADNPFGPEFRQALSATSSVCEINGLWISGQVAGRLLSRKVTAHGTALGYQLGHQAVVGMAHERAFEFVSGTLGFYRDPRFPVIPYPDDRFLSFVVWHRAGLEALRELEKQSPRAARRANAGNA